MANEVITDISMPGMNGLELVRKAKELKYCNHYVILTGYEEFEFARQAIRYKVNDYLLKPINKAELPEIILLVCGELNYTRKKGSLFFISKKPEPLTNSVLQYKSSVIYFTLTYSVY